ncbi:MAG TPA: hypothetical protein VNM45_22140, partial [Bacillus sp. (in: firmicutes)]|nr:hypothetical protein [Bacillus sp. (in: firmicutes)]
AAKSRFCGGAFLRGMKRATALFIPLKHDISNHQKKLIKYSCINTVKQAKNKTPVCIIYKERR